MFYLLIIFSIITIAYGVFITLAIIGFNRLRLKQNTVPSQYQPTEFISIVLSARNESTSIIKCLEQFEKQDFSKDKFEIILIDDASDDNTFLIAQTYLHKTALRFQVFQMPSHQGKKQNIAHAISLAKGGIIITTDADVLHRNSQYLKTVSHYFEMHEPAMLVMPIDFETNKGILNTFQITENLALTAINAGFVGLQKPFLCNGANLAFDKKAFLAVNGYQSHQSISSGEDVFLLEDIKLHFTAKSIHYGFSRSLIVKTVAESTTAAFFNQRLRWAYKAKYNRNALNLMAGFVIVLANLLIAALVVACIQKTIIAPYLVTFVVAKFIFDFLLLFLAADFLGRLKFMRWFFPFQLVYGIYALIVGLGSLFIKPRWKNKPIN